MDGTNPDAGNSAEPGDGQSREPRTSRLLACDMRLQDGAVLRIRVRNISAGGLGGRADAPVDAWQPVEVMLPGIGAVAGKIAWVRQDQFGVQFDRPIDPAKALVTSAQPQKSGHVVPPIYQPGSDYRRPGLRPR
ncbi:PilZ domain-containing protein [Sphingomonas colocasiae]|uniref:PilZ domain-containing protein n=1 Tax=Sphingomonas colocasiae TaxID=1848973 RepID=A0ABS7PR07_9SPHN|nr:PilZ domain-containing protein [Sphingomonas colocasiae]MBY8823765.1 PilZ domain-containing protein [Sphingomonas colocasiae]